MRELRQSFITSLLLFVLAISCQGDISFPSGPTDFPYAYEFKGVWAVEGIPGYRLKIGTDFGEFTPGFAAGGYGLANKFQSTLYFHHPGGQVLTGLERQVYGNGHVVYCVRTIHVLSESRAFQSWKLIATSRGVKGPKSGHGFMHKLPAGTTISGTAAFDPDQSALSSFQPALDISGTWDLPAYVPNADVQRSGAKVTYALYLAFPNFYAYFIGDYITNDEIVGIATLPTSDVARMISIKMVSKDQFIVHLLKDSEFPALTSGSDDIVPRVGS